MTLTVTHPTLESTEPYVSTAVRRKVGIRSDAAVSPRRIDLADLTPNNVGQLRKLNSVVLPVFYSDRYYKDLVQPRVRDVCKLGGLRMSQGDGDDGLLAQTLTIATSPLLLPFVSSASLPFCFAALFNDIPVGNICCRYEVAGEEAGPSSASTDSPRHVSVYIMTLAVLAPYRRLGIATQLVQHVLSVAAPGSTITIPLPTDKSKEKEKPVAAPAKKPDTPAPEPTEEVVVDRVYLHVHTINDEARDFYTRLGFVVAKELPEYYRKEIQPRSAWVLEKRA